MEISFIIPLFNRLDLTRPCLESLRASLPPGLAHEIILIDDGSTDGTREWLASLTTPPHVALFNERNSGYACANNRAASRARGTYLALVNSDLAFAPGWLEPMLRAFTRCSDAGIVGNRQVRALTGELDHAGLVINVKGKPEHLDHRYGRLHLFRAYSERPAVTGACCVAPRALFLELGGFDENFRNGGEDVDFCFRLRQRGRRVLVANRSVVRHFVSASPGRKTRDEHNSRRLCRKWRDQLIQDGARFWPRVYLHEHWHEPRDYDHALQWQALARRLGLVRRPAAYALALLARNIAIEEQRWTELLGPEESAA